MKSKFIQITSNEGSLYALDDEGNVWRLWNYDSGEQEWSLLEAKREE